MIRRVPDAPPGDRDSPDSTAPGWRARSLAAAAREAQDDLARRRELRAVRLTVAIVLGVAIGLVAYALCAIRGSL